ncbi:MAG: hypothetical protein LBL83_13760 [Clostridiales bacterium]|jgi:hypothetical protein|nr:hypothetical protein [Clostridiales bacterium]
MADRIELPMINLCPTMRCNLSCKLCGVLVPHYSCRPHMSLAEFADTLRAVFEIADHVGKLQITGGEPFLHRELPEMIDECFKHSGNFDRLWLFTNCAVPPAPRLIGALRGHKSKVLVHCSDYGAKPEVASMLLAALSENGIEYRYQKYYGEDQYYGGWVDQGDFVPHGRAEAELRDVFARCSHVRRGGSWYARGGQMHWCGRSARGCEVGKVPLRAEDSLDMLAGSADERRARLRELMRAEYILACDYCNGLYGSEDGGARRPAGEQMAGAQSGEAQAASAQMPVEQAAGEQTVGGQMA